MVVADRQVGALGARAELAARTAMTVPVDQPGQQRCAALPSGRHRGAHVLRGKVSRVADETDPVADDKHHAVLEHTVSGDDPPAQEHRAVAVHTPHHVVHRTGRESRRAGHLTTVRVVFNRVRCGRAVAATRRPGH